MDLLEILIQPSITFKLSLRGLLNDTSLSPLNSLICVVNQVWGQDSRILVKFFFCIFIDWDKVEVNKKPKREHPSWPNKPGQ